VVEAVMGVLTRLILTFGVGLGFSLTLLPEGVSRAAGETATLIIGWVEIAPSPERRGQLAVIGHVYAATASKGRYTLVISRAGRGGTTNTQQGGVFNVAAGEDKKLSTTAVNVAANDSLKIELKLYSEEREVFSVVMRPALDKGGRDI
jgi:hypothetical protein